MKDPIVEEIRKIRDEYAKKFDYDPHKIGMDIRKKQKKSQHRIIPVPKNTKTKNK